MYHTLKTLVDQKKISELKKLVKENAEFFENFDTRRNAKKYMKNKLSQDDIDSILPNRLQQRGNKIYDAVDSIMKGADVDAELEHIQNISKTANAANVAISMIKRELANRGYTQGVNDIKTSQVKDEVLKDKIAEREIATELNAEKENIVDSHFAFELVHERLKEYIKKGGDLNVNNDVIADIMINFSARPSELYNLVLTNGLITGQSKDRGNETYTKYIGILPADEAEALLAHMKRYSHMNPHGQTRTGQFIRYMKQYGMLPSQLRKIGAEYASMTEPNKLRRLKKRQQALRHKNISTSLMHYDVSDRTRYV